MSDETNTDETQDAPEGDQVVEQPDAVEDSYKGNRVVAWSANGPVRASDFDADSDDAQTVHQPGPELMGETAAQAEVNSGRADGGQVDEDDLSEVDGKNAGEMSSGSARPATTRPRPAPGGVLVREVERSGGRGRVRGRSTSTDLAGSCRPPALSG